VDKDSPDIHQELNKLKTKIQEAQRVVSGIFKMRFSIKCLLTQHTNDNPRRYFHIHIFGIFIHKMSFICKFG
uniref:Uncharacterized protein n=1 Tax=Sinocyclocheilus grahami TaxID=75366 RepID=A0A672M6P8_SINGR